VWYRIAIRISTRKLAVGAGIQSTSPTLRAWELAYLDSTTVQFLPQPYSKQAKDPRTAAYKNKMQRVLASHVVEIAQNVRTVIHARGAETESTSAAARVSRCVRLNPMPEVLDTKDARVVRPQS